MRAYLEANAFSDREGGRLCRELACDPPAEPCLRLDRAAPDGELASTELSRLAARRVTEAVSTMASDWGLIFFGDDSN